jgi:hypothetical protein
MAMHIGWQDEGFWSHVGLWNNGETVERYFGEVAIDRISRAIQILGAIPNRDGASDVEPERYEVVNFILGPHSRKFVDIGEDREGDAVNVLGSHPLVMQLTIEGFTPVLYSELIERLSYRSEIPGELIAHYVTLESDGMRIVEIWSGHGHALATLGEQMLPTIDHIAKQHSVALPCDHTTREIRRVALSDEVVTASGF